MNWGDAWKYYFPVISDVIQWRHRNVPRRHKCTNIRCFLYENVMKWSLYLISRIKRVAASREISVYTVGGGNGGHLGYKYCFYCHWHCNVFKKMYFLGNLCVLFTTMHYRKLRKSEKKASMHAAFFSRGLYWWRNYLKVFPLRLSLCWRYCSAVTS